MSRKKILIVDDDKDLLRGLNIRLKAHGYEIVFATDGISAINMARKEEPNLIILDIGLPGGDGFMVMERLSRLMSVAFTPTIILTARNLNSEDKLTLAGMGARAFFQKPADNNELLSNIRKALGEKDEPVPEKQHSPKVGSYMSRKKILVVDSDKDFLHALSIKLGDRGYEVFFASDVFSAVSVTRKQNPDLLILDIGLPGGEGFMVMEQVRALDPSAPIPIIILTACDPSVNMKRSFDAGARAFFQKTVDDKDLLSAIQKILGGSNGK